MPKFTIIVPTDNEERYVAMAVGSFLNQSEVDFRLIVVDDESSDGIGALIAGFGAEDGRLRHLSLGRVDQVAAFDLAVSLAGGDWHYFMGADDFVQSDTLECRAELVHDCDPDRRIAARARPVMTSELEEGRTYVAE